MIELSAEVGYQEASIRRVSAQAKVSRSTFYEQFMDKEDCAVAAYRAAAERILERVQQVVVDALASREDWSSAARAGFGALMDALREDPSAGDVLFVEALAGGPRIREERTQGLARVERRAQAFLDSTPRDTKTLDIPATALVGAVRSIVSRRIHAQAEDTLPSLAGDMVRWLESYARPAGSERWSTGGGALLPPAPTREAPQAPGARARLPRGRHALPARVVSRSQRTRIIHGMAEAMQAEGYAETTVADIVAAAGVSREVFYKHFTDKQHAFLEAQQHLTQGILETCATAYFKAGTWPERAWRGLAALLDLIAETPAASHLRLVECYAAGPAAIRRAEEITRSLAIFLEEGYGYRPEARDLPRLCSEAIAGAVYEIAQRYAARHDVAALPRELPRLAYITIAPFTGPKEAIRLIEKLTARRGEAGGA